jgi:uncharacterized protein (DUF58 family)
MPRRLRPTRAGWTFFLFTFGVGFAALNTGNNLLYLVLALMLAFLVLSGVLSESALRGIQVRRRLPSELEAERETLVTLEIANTQRRVTSFAVVIEDRITSSAGFDSPAGRCFALRIGPGRTEVRSYRFQPRQRGPLEFQGFVVFTRFPFGLFSKSLTLDAPSCTLVYPATEAVSFPPDFGGSRAGAEGAGGGAGRSSDVRGLREYAAGDALRRIHWPSSLRVGELTVRDVENEPEAEVEVRLRTLGERPGEAFERRVSWSASEVASLLEMGARVALRTDREYFPAGAGPRQRARLLSYLALVQPTPVAEVP